MPIDSPNNNNRGTLASLLQVLDRPGPLVILPHDNPDPDALASAAALKYLVGELLRKEAHIALGGIVGRAENRAMLTYLNITLVPVSEVHFSGETQVALVDTQPGRPNNSLPEALVPTAVIDHHPAYDAYPGVPFLDLRDQYGATSTILTEYLRESKLAIEPEIGTFGSCLHCSIRTTERDVNAGDLLQQVLGSKLAGGHDMIAGGRIHVGPDPAEHDRAAAMVRDRLLRALGLDAAGGQPLVA